MSDSKLVFKDSFAVTDIETVTQQVMAYIGHYRIICLTGEVGSGKTTLSKSLLKTLGYQKAVDSPTFNLVNTYHWANQTVYHFDLYRIQSVQELNEIGFLEYLDSGHLCLIEWPELVLDFLDQPYLNLRIEHHDNMRHYELITIN